MLLISAYQKVISPLLGERCKYYPSCSEYAKQSIKQRGFFLGTVLSIIRILKCNPFSKGGFDYPNKKGEQE